jgi:ammonium transporter, Amt family
VRDAQVMAQLKAVALTLVWSGIGTAVILKVVDVLIGTRVSPDAETQGLDLAEHGERGYVYEN